MAERTDGTQPSVRAVERALLLLEQLAACEDASLGELSAATGLHKTTVFRLLGTLEACGYAVQEQKTQRYALTPRLLRVCADRLTQLYADVRAQVRPVLLPLALSCGETVHLVRREGDTAVYIDKLEAPQNTVRLVSRIGAAVPLPCTAVGKALLSADSDGDAATVWARFCAASGRAADPAAQAAFLRELADVRKNGFAVDDEENEPSVRCVACVLPDTSGARRYAFSVSAPVQRMDDAALARTAQAVCDAARQIGTLIG